jgi:hypothetical protein
VKHDSLDTSGKGLQVGKETRNHLVAGEGMLENKRNGCLVHEFGVEVTVETNVQTSGVRELCCPRSSTLDSSIKSVLMGGDTMLKEKDKVHGQKETLFSFIDHNPPNAVRSKGIISEMGGHSSRANSVVSDIECDPVEGGPGKVVKGHVLENENSRFIIPKINLNSALVVRVLNS